MCTVWYRFGSLANSIDRNNRVIELTKQICQYAVTRINNVCQWSETVPNAFEINIISNGDTAEWSPIDLFSLNVLFCHFKRRDALMGICLLFFSLVYLHFLGRHLKETIPSSSITCSEKGKQNIQAKKVCSVCNHTSYNKIGRQRSGTSICLSRVWLQTELDYTKSYCQLIIKIINSEKRKIEKKTAKKLSILKKAPI